MRVLLVALFVVVALGNIALGAFLLCSGRGGLVAVDHRGDFLCIFLIDIGVAQLFVLLILFGVWVREYIQMWLLRRRFLRKARESSSAPGARSD